MRPPNVLIILNDDMGYSDLGCYGGEAETPNLDSLALGGLRYTQFYNTARCCPSRASLLTGLHPHQAAVGHMMLDDGLEGYRGDLNANTVTMAEALREGGYSTYMSGKWHVTRNIQTPGPNWPRQRGFDDFYGILCGAASYYAPNTLYRNEEFLEPEEVFFLTDAISDEAVRQIRDHRHEEKPFFQYVAYTAPHWPLHAHPEDIAKYRGRFDAGWDQLREERLSRLIQLGMIDENLAMSERDPEIAPWKDVENKEWEVRRMEVYAAQLDRMDQGIGRILKALQEADVLDDTLIFFLSDNGGCAEELDADSSSWLAKSKLTSARKETLDGRTVRFGNQPDILPGPDDTYTSYGRPWANVSNTPFRLYKHWVHEGGIATPLIVHWPNGIDKAGQLRHQAAQLPDIMATVLDCTGVEYPEHYDGKSIKPLEGFSMAATFRDEPHPRDALYWEHEGNRAVRRGRWKLVCKHPGPWELYDIKMDRSELNDVAEEQPEIVQELVALYEAWAKRCQVVPWDELCQKRKLTSN